ncbi:MAG: DNA methyltransferase, partial [Deltaproteobacteria bacterium]|nr:DNA methyltransferase [Deltaproteobacteria bacterium]
MIDTYINKIASITKQGDAREESYYPALAALLEEFSETKRKKKAHVTVLPKKTEAGNPDFRVWDGKHSQVGYVEAKPPTVNLDVIETSEQLKRYISTFPNLILTNFYEFRLYRNGQRVAHVLLARPYIPTKLKIIPPAEHTAEFLALLERFFQFSLPTKFSAESLAKELATRTRFLRDQVIKEELRETSSAGAKKILGFYEAFQKHLIFNLKPDEFADLYAQTITYGL